MYVRLFGRNLCKFNGVLSGYHNRHVSALSSVTSSSDKGQLVYRNKKRSFVIALKTISVSSTSLTLAFQPYAYFNFPKGDIAFIAIYMGLNFSMMTLFILHAFTKSFVTDLYYNKQNNTFTAYTKGLLCNNKVLTFKPEDVSFDITSLAFANLTVKNRPLFINEEDFADVEIYRKLIGYDKPLDFE